MLVDCLMQVYRIGFLVTSLPVNCNIKDCEKFGKATFLLILQAIFSIIMEQVYMLYF